MNSEKKRASKSLSFSMQAMALLFVLLMTYTRTWSQCPGSVTITPVLISCNGAGDGELTASLAGSGPYTYLWNTGQTDAHLTDLNAIASGTTYTVTVTDQGNSNCTKSASYTLYDPVELSVEFDWSAVCYGEGATLDITVTGGTAPFTFLWNGGNTNEDLTGLSAGTNTVTVTDAHGCVYSASSASPNANGQIVIATDHITNECAGAANGEIQVDVSGGVMPVIMYEWYLTSNLVDEITLVNNNNPASGLGPDNYTLVVTDAAGCTQTATFTVGTNPLPTPVITISETSGLTMHDGTTCAGAPVNLGTTQSYVDYSWWNTSETTASITVSPTATTVYTVAVTDGNNCTGTGTTTITVIPLPASPLNNNITYHSAAWTGQGVEVKLATSPPNGQLWYWQTLPTGTLTSYASTSNYPTQTSAGPHLIYLRAFVTATGCWSNEY